MSTKQLTKAFSKITISESTPNPEHIPDTVVPSANVHGPKDLYEQTKTYQPLTQNPCRASCISYFFPDPLWYEKYMAEANIDTLQPNSEIRHALDNNTEYGMMIINWFLRESNVRYKLCIEEQTPKSKLYITKDLPSTWDIPFDEFLKQVQERRSQLTQDRDPSSG
jgi:hypothetical protein